MRVPYAVSQWQHPRTGLCARANLKLNGQPGVFQRVNYELFHMLSFNWEMGATAVSHPVISQLEWGWWQSTAVCLLWTQYTVCTVLCTHSMCNVMDDGLWTLCWLNVQLTFLYVPLFSFLLLVFHWQATIMGPVSVMLSHLLLLLS